MWSETGDLRPSWRRRSKSLLFTEIYNSIQGTLRSNGVQLLLTLSDMKSPLRNPLSRIPPQHLINHSPYRTPPFPSRWDLNPYNRFLKGREYFQIQNSMVRKPLSSLSNSHDLAIRKGSMWHQKKTLREL